MRDQNMKQPSNPTDEQRYALLSDVLKKANRLVDFPYIIKALNPPEDITSIAQPGEFKGVRVAVLGGGVAGLSAAYELRKIGCDITLFEAEERVGGRVYTYYFDEEKDLFGELGAMRIPVGHQSTWHYINLFKLNTNAFIQNNENAFIYVRDIRVRNDANGESVSEKIYPEFPLTPREKSMSWQELIGYGTNSPLFTMSPTVRQEIVYSLPKYNPKMVYWVAKNSRQVLQKMKLSQGAINLIGSITPLLGSMFYNSYSEVFQENYTGDFEYLYQIDDGFDQLPNAFYEALTGRRPEAYEGFNKEDLGNVDIKLGHIVEAIKQVEGNQVEVAYGKTLGNPQHQHETDTFDYVICTLPYSRLRTVELDPILGDRKMEAIREVNYNDIQKTLFLCKKRFWLEQGIYGGGSSTDEVISSIWYPVDGVKDPNVPGVLTASYNLGLNASYLGNLSDERRIEVIKRQVEKVHGLEEGYLDEIVMDYKTMNWGSAPLYLGICLYSPEQKTIFSASMDTPVYNNHMFFAGVHISETHGWLQGALKTAMEAANGIAYQCRLNRYEK
ncbi:flavin monoamine oxidase family protein [Vallitalea okinawensis]|uniref:flavin monoamine oxidase family protein n=1 Tax=Vallitalea okinawensis TaxID=2078660 RepID=UPI000CFC8031|nr:FAD-dependent oxidoreductase [Vallitalea okinawensis]